MRYPTKDNKVSHSLPRSARSCGSMIILWGRYHPDVQTEAEG